MLNPPKVETKICKQKNDKWIVMRVTREVQEELVKHSTSMRDTYDRILRRILNLKPNITLRKEHANDNSRRPEN